MSRGRHLRSWLVQEAWERLGMAGAVVAGGRRAGRFGHFGQGSIIVFPWATLYGERWIHVGDDVRIGPYSSLSAGIHPDQVPLATPVVRIGDRCVLGRGTTITGHLSVTIGDDVWAGNDVFVTDQNHGYEDLALPIGRQSMPERPVVIGDGSWLGAGVVVLPGSRVGRHVVVAAGAVVTGDIPDNCVAAGVPARVVRRHVDGQGWKREAD